MFRISKMLQSKIKMHITQIKLIITYNVNNSTDFNRFSRKHGLDLIKSDHQNRAICLNGKYQRLESLLALSLQLSIIVVMIDIKCRNLSFWELFTEELLFIVQVLLCIMFRFFDVLWDWSGRGFECPVGRVPIRRQVSIWPIVQLAELSERERYQLRVKWSGSLISGKLRFSPCVLLEFDRLV